VKLLNQDEVKYKIVWKHNNMGKQMMVEKVYLWIMLFLKFTVDIFYLFKSITNKIE